MSEYWVHKVTTVSTFPPEGTFTKPAREVAEIMARPAVSPLGVHSGVKMIHYFVNRGGKGVSPGRKQALRKAAELLKEMEPPPWDDPPKKCDRCGRRFSTSFYVVRKKSDKQLAAWCPTCREAEAEDVSEATRYRRQGKRAVNAEAYS